MAELVVFTEQLIILYCTAAAGYIAKAKGIISSRTDQAVSQLILYITLPSLVLYSMDYPFSVSIIKDFGWLTALSISSLVFGCIFAYVLSRRLNIPANKRGVYQGLIIFGNQGFLGYAVCQSIFGKDGSMYAAIFNLAYLLLIWTYGIYIIAKGDYTITWKILILNPGILATLLGLLVFFLPFEWPPIVSKFFMSLGTPTVPLSMLLIGSSIADIDIRELWMECRNVYLWLTVIIKLLITPIFLFIFIFLYPRFIIFGVAVMISAMPSAPTTVIYAKKYGGDAVFASIGVCISTLLSVFTLPLIYLLLIKFIK